MTQQTNPGSPDGNTEREMARKTLPQVARVTSFGRVASIGNVKHGIGRMDHDGCYRAPRSDATWSRSALEAFTGKCFAFPFLGNVGNVGSSDNYSRFLAAARVIDC